MRSHRVQWESAQLASLWESVSRRKECDGAKMAVRIEYVDEAMTGAGYVIVLLRILLRICHEQVAVDVGNVEWRMAATRPFVSGTDSGGAIFGGLAQCRKTDRQWHSGFVG